MANKDRRAEEPGELRIGIIVDTTLCEGWQFFMLQNALAATAGDLAVIIEINVATRSRHAQANLLARMVHGVEKRFIARAMESPLARKGVNMDRLQQPAQPVRALVENTVCVSVQAHGESDVKRAVKDGLSKAGIAVQDLDVLINLASLPPEGILNQAPKHGVWAFFCGDGCVAEPCQFGIQDVLRNNANTLVQIACWTGAQTGWRQINAGRYPVFRWSWSLNARLLGYKSGWLLVDALRRLRTDIPRQEIDKRSEKTRLTTQQAAPGGLKLAVGAALIAGRFIGEAVKRLTVEENWRILLWFQADLSEVTTQPPRILEPPPTSFWADPFVARQDDRLAVFFEEYLYAEGRGIISFVEIDDPRQLASPAVLKAKRLIEEDHHLSYPYLFRHAGELMMIPESSEAKQVALWRCREFPGVWEKAGILLSGPSAADCSAILWSGRWWLFANLDRSDMADHCYELHLYYSDRLLSGDWRAHPENPVVVDATCARMAGGFTTSPDGELVRICQIQGKNYGEGVTFRKITHLSDTTYAEEAFPCDIKAAHWGYSKGHHLNIADAAIVADGCNYDWKLRRMFK